MVTRLLLALLLLAASAPRLGAQGVPVQDRRAMQAWLQNMLTQAAEWYGHARSWRDVSLEKAGALIEQTRQQTLIRERLERIAVGELGRLGEAVPDWRDLGQLCAVDETGERRCMPGPVLDARYERAVQAMVFVIRHRDLRGSAQEVQASVERFIGQQFALGAEHALETVRNTGFVHLGRGTDVWVAQASHASSLEDLAARVNALADSLQMEEVDSQAVSSGRARQLTLRLAETEALLEVEIVRSRLQAHDVRVTEVADRVARMRRSGGARALSLVW